FESQEVAIDGREEVNVALNEDVTSLSEVVVVTGYGSTFGNRAENTTYRSAEPIGGRNDFKKYLETAVQYPAEAVTNKIEGRVTLRFTVEADGQLTNFEVIKGIGSGTEDALINAIKSGPKWKPGAQGDQPIADKVKVRYRFKLPE
ncbi:MAG TPA: TonB family protein, partial [Chryseosolibacter sp.]|nr:TonB family protein [Chryseosolibacter sp.]